MAEQPQTVGQFLHRMADRIYPAGDPERVFVDWLIANMRDLRGAANALGVTVEEGPDFAKRLKAAVLPKLLEQDEPR